MTEGDHLQQREKEFHILLYGLLENPYLAYIIVDKEGMITAINKTALDFLGIVKEAALGKYIMDVVPNSQLPQILETGRTDRADLWSINGHDSIVNRFPVVKNGEIIGAMGYSVFLDMSGAEVLMNRLHEREREFDVLLHGLLENPYLAYIIIDNKGLITAINQTTLDVLDIKKEAALGKYVLDVVPNSRLPQIVKTGRTDRADFWPINGHDTIVNRVPIRKNGEIIGAIGYSLFLNMSGAMVLANKLQEMEKELNSYKNEICGIYNAKWEFDDLIGDSGPFAMVRSIAERISVTTSTVLITGDSGTGKELFAQAIHNASNRSMDPFIRINCVALPENLMESELFGYEEGAFTGARKGGKPGKFELAAGGTIFLDEIGDMPLAMQTKLLVVLQEKMVERVGGTTPIPVDVRVIAATNRDLERMVEEKKFREDLYYRLNVVRLDIPPLRRRMEDLPLLVKNLMFRLNRTLETNVYSISEQAMDLLMQYSWPGNVRELENLLERAINLAFINQEKCLGVKHFPSLAERVYDEIAPVLAAPRSLPETIQNVEKEMISQALSKTNGNKIQAAKLLGIYTSALYRKVSKYGLG